MKGSGSQSPSGRSCESTTSALAISSRRTTRSKKSPKKSMTTASEKGMPTPISLLSGVNRVLARSAALAVLRQRTTTSAHLAYAACRKSRSMPGGQSSVRRAAAVDALVAMKSFRSLTFQPRWRRVEACLLSSAIPTPAAAPLPHQHPRLLPPLPSLLPL